jgi:flavin-dependent dehydrogenase
MFDAIVVGARCAGSPTAMLLGRRGYRVLLVDRARFPSDTISTHFIWAPGVACLKRWGLFDRLLASNCPTMTRLTLDLGVYELIGTPPPFQGASEMIAPRRTVLDKLLVDGAGEAGVEVREEFSVTGLTFSDGRVTGIKGRGRNGAEVEEHARIVIGADGFRSLVARTVGADEYNVRGQLSCCYYAYWSGVDRPLMPAIRPRPRRTVFNFPTNDGLEITPVCFPREDFEEFKSDFEGNLEAALAMVADFEGPLRSAQRVEHIVGTGDIPNFFRKPYGDGWALVGDAGYHKDPVTAQGISDAFRSAELLVEALDAGFSGARPLDEALANYQRARDEMFGPAFELTCGLATIAPPPPEMLAVYEALRTNEVERNRFFGCLAGTVPIPEYFAPENLSRIVEGKPAQS